MLGHDDDYVAGLERAHHAHLDDGDGLAAVRCAFWIGHNFLFRGDNVSATGWFARAQRVLEREERGLRGARLPADPRLVEANG